MSAKMVDKFILLSVAPGTVFCAGKPLHCNNINGTSRKN